MLKIAVTAPISTARIRTTVPDSQPPLPRQRGVIQELSRKMGVKSHPHEISARIGGRHGRKRFVTRIG
jgi:hypothetical protein